MHGPLSPDACIQVYAELMGLARIRSRYEPAGWPIGSQCGEDLILAKLLPEQNGTYVDIGAHHPIYCNNTWALYQRGWRGLLIEPLPDMWFPLMYLRRGDYLVGVLSNDYDGWTILRLCRALSTIRPDLDIEEQGRIFCPCEKLETTLKQFPAIRDNCRFCSIDVEGVEKAVLDGINWETFHPEVFAVEFRLPGTTPALLDTSSTWEPILTSHGYHKVGNTDFNGIYLRDDRWQKEYAATPGVPQ